QLSFLYIPAIIVHGNTLSLDGYAHWYTPAHILGGWSRKLRQEKVEPITEYIEPPVIEASRQIGQLALF
ncbi:hypothetical protein SL617_30605, partial [Klebsiella michiganensis]